MEVPVDVVHVPVLPDPASSHWDEITAISEAAPDGAAGTTAVYLEFLERFPDGFAQAVAAVAGAGEGGVLVHCMAGKDRTGLVSALLLRLTGVPVADVAADYAVSERNLEAYSGPWIAEAPDEHERERRRRIAATPAAAMTAVLAELDRRGGAAGYLRDAGVSDTELEHVRTRLLA